MATAQDTLDANESIEHAYPYDIRIVRVDREDDRPIYRFEAPMYSPKDTDNTPEWENPHLAKLYADVYLAVGSFREEKTGRRGIPPEVERDGREAVVAYLTTQDGISTDWLSTFYDISDQTVYEYRSRIRARAREAEEEENTDE